MIPAHWESNGAGESPPCALVSKAAIGNLKLVSSLNPTRSRRPIFEDLARSATAAGGCSGSNRPSTDCGTPGRKIAAAKTRRHAPVAHRVDESWMTVSPSHLQAPTHRLGFLRWRFRRRLRSKRSLRKTTVALASTGPLIVSDLGVARMAIALGSLSEGRWRTVTTTKKQVLQRDMP